jgi:hypothetical protein
MYYPAWWKLVGLDGSVTRLQLYCILSSVLIIYILFLRRIGNGGGKKKLAVLLELFFAAMLIGNIICHFMGIRALLFSPIGIIIGFPNIFPYLLFDKVMPRFGAAAVVFAFILLYNILITLLMMRLNYKKPAIKYISIVLSYMQSGSYFIIFLMAHSVFSAT